MSGKPLLPKDIYEKYVSKDGHVTIPSDESEKKLLGRTLLGKELIGKFDYWLGLAIELILKEPKATKKPNLIEKNSIYFHQNFKDLSDIQKKAIENLVREISLGVLFSNLVTLDQFHFGKFHFSLKIRDSETEVPILDDSLLLDDLHDELNEWIISFSKYSDEILELVEKKTGWQFQPKDFVSY